MKFPSKLCFQFSLPILVETIALLLPSINLKLPFREVLTKMSLVSRLIESFLKISSDFTILFYDIIMSFLHHVSATDASAEEWYCSCMLLRMPKDAQETASDNQQETEGKPNNIP